MRVFLDTNVLVSAFAARGLCADLFEVVLLEHGLITGDRVLAELARALETKLKMPARRSGEIVVYVGESADTRVHASTPAVARVDPDDASILGEALAGSAEIFVTGDAAVLRLRALERMKILSPRDFWTFLHSEPRPR